MAVTALVAFAVALAGTALVMVGLRHMLPTDVPNDRSSHDKPTLRGGGVAPVVAVLVAVGIAGQLTGRARIGVLAATTCFAALGLVEDVRGVSVLARFGLQVVAAAVALAGLLGGLTGSGLWQVAFAAGALLWIVSYVNAYNFMDGIDGMAVAQTLLAGTAWYLVGRAEHTPALAAGGLAVAGAALGFAPFNFPRARIFLGDVGSYGLGAALAALAVVGVRAGITPEAVLAPLGLYLADTGVTLVRRVVRGEAWYLPHRDHAYQRLVRRGWSHVRTTVVALAWMAACSAAGALTLTDSVAVRVAADTVLVALLVAWLASPSLVGRRQRRRAGAGRAPLPPATSSSGSSAAR